MKVILSPGRLHGALNAIPSKSAAHRLLICAALADAPTTLKLGVSNKDIDATIACLRALGAGIAWQGDTLTVTPITPTSTPLLDCGESGSTLRFLLPVAAALGCDASFQGAGRLPERPIGELLLALQTHGVKASAPKLPLTLTDKLQSGAYTLPGNISSQYITGLLLALPLLEGDSTLHLTTALESAAYVDITLAALRRFGILLEPVPSGWRVPGGQVYRSPGTLTVEGDWSNAAFFLTANALGSDVELHGLDPASPQGDKAITAVLNAFTENAPQPRVIDLRPIPDLLPALAVVAALTPGQTHFTGGERLRLKESDRLASTAAMLNGLGGSVEILPDGLLVHGSQLCGGEVDGANDHRIVMAAAIAATRCTGSVTILGAEAVHKSYPNFFNDLAMLGGDVHVV